MAKMIIEGGHPLNGTIKISGAKNAVVALIPEAILTEEETIIYNVPDIDDTKSLITILEYLNVKVDYHDDCLKIDSSHIENKPIPEELSKKLRASYYFMGALLARFHQVDINFPGGCNIGSRPIDLHLKGFKSLGAKVKSKGDFYSITVDSLVGTKIYLDFASVGATINLMFAASLAEGETIISNAAKEPEIVNVASFLNNMGAKITGAGTSDIRIIGVKKLHKGVIETIPDRIEAGTYLIAGALIGQDLVIDGIIKDHLEALISKMQDMGANMKIEKDKITISKAPSYKAINIKTLVFPGFPTDLGQPIQVLLTQALGTSIFEETIYENRMGHIKYLQKMGSSIDLKNNIALITGPSLLHGEEVIATDLRAGAALVLAALIAEGKTTINEVSHILRGYSDIVEKLNNVGAKIVLDN